MKKSKKNRFYSIKTSEGNTKNFTVFADGTVSLQTINNGIISKPKRIGKI